MSFAVVYVEDKKERYTHDDIITIHNTIEGARERVRQGWVTCCERDMWANVWDDVMDAIDNLQVDSHVDNPFRGNKMMWIIVER